jgi:hypothetical protein
MGFKNLRCFEFSKLLFLIFENNIQILNIKYFLELIFKNEKEWLRKLETPQIYVPLRFQYEEFNESDKLKFEYHLIYFLS